jgi:hypothetical protein
MMECSICFESLESSQTTKLACHDSHVFHTECIKHWNIPKRGCPLCRQGMESKDYLLDEGSFVDLVSGESLEGGRVLRQEVYQPAGPNHFTRIDTSTFEYYLSDDLSD